MARPTGPRHGRTGTRTARERSSGGLGGVGWTLFTSAHTVAPQVVPRRVPEWICRTVAPRPIVSCEMQGALAPPTQSIRVACCQLRPLLNDGDANERSTRAA